MKRVIALMCLCTLVVVGSTGCFGLNSTRNYYDVNKDTQQRLDNLEGRVGQIEGCQALCPLTAKPACEMTTPPSCAAMPEQK